MKSINALGFTALTVMFVPLQIVLLGVSKILMISGALAMFALNLTNIFLVMVMPEELKQAILRAQERKAKDA